MNNIFNGGTCACFCSELSKTLSLKQKTRPLVLSLPNNSPTPLVNTTRALVIEQVPNNSQTSREKMPRLTQFPWQSKKKIGEPKENEPMESEPIDWRRVDAADVSMQELRDMEKYISGRIRERRVQSRTFWLTLPLLTALSWGGIQKGSGSHLEASRGGRVLRSFWSFLLSYKSPAPQ